VRGGGAGGGGTDGCGSGLVAVYFRFVRCELPHVIELRRELGVAKKVLKALAEYFDISLGELTEVINLQSLEGAAGFNPSTLRKIVELKKVYDMDYGLEQAREKMFR
jgi:hypothetical protein